MHSKLAILLLLILCSTSSVFAQQPTTDKPITFSLQTDIVTKHWESKSYNEDPNLIVLEYYPNNNNKLYGIAAFKNSFYQPSWYIYTAKRYALYEYHDLKFRWKLTYGIVHGYDDENGKYDGFINKLGTFPAILPTIGFNYKHLVVELFPLANEGFLITSGIEF